ncbi:MAG: hypothetical protein HRT68_00810 [Flavobacteriaceae bacterium]|nr:hypothetical protein [Flavobacteriaceae bacterium]
MKRFVQILVFLFCCYGFSQNYACQMDFGGLDQNSQFFQFNKSRIESKELQFGDYLINLKIEDHDEEWRIEVKVFNYKIQKESLYETASQYAVDSGEIPFHLFTELFIRDTFHLICDCQKA